MPRALLKWPDNFTFLGAFDVPHLVSGLSTYGNNSGLALRRVAGQLRFLARTGAGGPNQQRLYEGVVPALKLSPPYNVATVVTSWGVDYAQAFAWAPPSWTNAVTNASAGYQFGGLYWDESTSRLYSGYTQTYPDLSASNDPSLFYVTLDNPATPSLTCYGPLRFGSPTQCGQGVTKIPDWYADAYLGGHPRFAAGFGGYFSRFFAGDGRCAPALYSVTPPVSPVQSHPIVVGPGGGAGPTDAFTPAVVASQTALISFSGQQGWRDRNYENRKPTLLLTGNVVAATTNTVTVSKSQTATDYPWARYFCGCRIEIVSGLGAGQAKKIIDQNAATQVLTTDSNWTTTPNSGSVYKIYRGGVSRGDPFNSLLQISSVVNSGTPSFAANLAYSNVAGAGGNAGMLTGMFNGFKCYIVGGTGAGQNKTIASSVFSVGTGLTTFNFGSSWGVNLDATSVFTVDGPSCKGMSAAADATSLTLDATCDPVVGNLDDGEHCILMLTGPAAGEERKIATFNVGTRKVTLGSGIFGGSLGTPIAGSTWHTTPTGGGGDDYLIRPSGVATFSLFPTATRGYQTYKDYYGGACCHVDTNAGGNASAGGTHGLLMFNTRVTGQAWYESSDIHYESYKHTLQCFDPMLFPPVTSGSSELDAAWEQDIQFDGITYPITDFYGFPIIGNPPNFSGNEQRAVGGMAFDFTTNILYVLVSDVNGSPGSEYTPRVYAWQIVDTAIAPPPPQPVNPGSLIASMVA